MRASSGPGRELGSWRCCSRFHPSRSQSPMRGHRLSPMSPRLIETDITGIETERMCINPRGVWMDRFRLEQQRDVGTANIASASIDPEHAQATAA